MTRIALVQTCSSREVDRNIERVGALVAEAAGQDVSAIFLPENWGSLANPSPRAVGEAEQDAGPLRTAMAELARENKVWIFAGTIPVSVRPDGSDVSGGRVRAASIVYDQTGREAARYDKIHMFDVDVADNHKHYLESATFEPGEDLVCVDLPDLRVGLSVCYDIRFPELYRKLSARGAQALAIPSAFTRPTGAAHFEVLMRARAIENFAFTIAACQAGTHDSGRETWGNSMVVDPWGEVLCRADDHSEAILVAQLDLARQAQVRADMPVHRQRRLRDID